jgi:hypothetical protein
VNRTFLVLSLAGLAFGCASAGTSAFSQQLSNTQTTLEMANQRGAAQDVRAAQQLRLAKEEVDRAEQLMRDRDEPAAHDMLVRAQADAELAIALSDESRQYAEAHAVLDKLHSLEQKGGQR